MTCGCPSQLRAIEQGIDAHAHHICSIKDFRGRNFILSFDVNEFPEASHVKGVELLGMPTVDNPCFTTH